MLFGPPPFLSSETKWRAVLNMDDPGSKQLAVYKRLHI